MEQFEKFLYGTAKVKIFTDHQPLTYALSTRNTNVKLKRWKEKLETFDYEIIYKPGVANVVADALSRPPVTKINSMSATVHSDESSGQNLVHSVESPINTFKNQICIKEGEENYKLENPFHPIIDTSSKYQESLRTSLKKY